MTDKELEGIAAQAFNMAKRDMKRGSFNFLLAAYHEGEGLHRMRQLEALILEKLGEDWLNNGEAKDAGFSVMRMAIDIYPPEAVVFCTACNKFEPTAKLSALPAEEQYRMLHKTDHDEHHRMVRQGYLAVQDALMCCAQTPERVCLYSRAILLGAGYSGQAKVDFFDQAGFDGRLKMYGAHYVAPLDPTKRTQ